MRPAERETYYEVGVQLFPFGWAVAYVHLGLQVNGYGLRSANADEAPYVCLFCLAAASNVYCSRAIWPGRLPNCSAWPAPLQRNCLVTLSRPAGKRFWRVPFLSGILKCLFTEASSLSDKAQNLRVQLSLLLFHLWDLPRIQALTVFPGQLQSLALHTWCSHVLFAGRVNIVVPRPSRVYASDAAQMQLQAGVDPSRVDFK